MQHQDRMSRKRLLRLLAVVGLAAASLLATWLLVQAYSAPAAIELGDVIGENDRLHAWPPLQASQPLTVYLPLVGRNFPPPPPVFGVEINRSYVSAIASRASEAGVWWVRYNGLLWSEVEATQGVRDWTALANEESELQALATQGLTPMVVIRGTPAWAQKWAGYYCGPIKQDALDDFADFVGEVVARYSGEPYNVKYWEIWNEPDAHNSIPPTAPYGCWGDTTDAFYGGEYYAEMLKYVYPAVKGADPGAEVVLGGLLMWCDHEDPAPAPGIGNCPSAKFLEGILRHGGGAYFDVMAYHAYPYWDPAFGNTDWDLNQIHWDHRGGVLLGKLDFIQNVFAQFGVDKPIIMNEGGLMCHVDDNDHPDCVSNELKAAQANYVVRLFARTWANDILGSTWYTLNGPGWRQGGLLDDSQLPRPAYDSFRFMAQLLEGASYAGQLSSGSLEGYAFRNESAHREYRVYWTNDGSTVPVALPSSPSIVYDKFGNNITPGGGTVSVGFDPIYVELAP
jgi:hypothetical protein